MSCFLGDAPQSIEGGGSGCLLLPGQVQTQGHGFRKRTPVCGECVHRRKIRRRSPIGVG